jgi:hypothetical protein
MKQGHVICCNDRPVMICLGSQEKAKELMNELEAQECKSFLSKQRKGINELPIGPKNYRRLFYWHVETVKVKEDIP